MMATMQDISLEASSGFWRRLEIRFSIAWRRFVWSWAIFRRNRLAMLGVVMLVLFALMAAIQPILIESGVWPRGIYHAQTGYDGTISPWPAPPGEGHVLGVDALGRDNLSRLMAATRPTFVLALTAAATTAVLSTLFGAFSAYYRGPLDFIFTHIADALLLIPPPVLMIVLSSRYYEHLSAAVFGLIYGVLVGGGSGAIVMRSHALRLVQQPFVQAARVAGADGPRIIFRHLVPHMLPLAGAHMMSVVVGAVVADGFIGFLGFRAVRLNWGQMVYEAIGWLNVFSEPSWAAIFAPALALSLFAAAFYFISRGLHDVVDPRLQS
ncbi:MAG: ABC transporter permease subunit [Aggregatilineales bacterium]|nr:ABC transporter permease [Chloroflexota bacterium]